MIKEIYISNYALIDDLQLPLDKGFSTITGDTGAGKSILLEALGLALGERADKSAVRDKEKKCIVEVQFDIKNYLLKPMFEGLDWDYDELTIVRREILPSGKSRAFVNDMPVVLTDLKSLGTHLIRISSQHETLALREQDFQLNLVDSFVKNQALLEEVKNIHQLWKKKSHQLLSAEQEIAKVKGDREYLEFQLNELQAAQLEEESLEDLEQELQVAEKAEQLIESSGFSAQVLNEENGVLDLLGKTEQELKKVARFDQSLDAFYQRIQAVKEELKDIAMGLEEYTEKVDLSPERLNYLNQRVDVLNQLLLKHKKNNVAELKDLRDEIANQLDNSEALEMDLSKLKEECHQLESSYKDTAKKLTKDRKDAALIIEKEVRQLLSNLGMADAEIQFVFAEETRMTPHGADQIELQFKANEGMGYQNLKKTASGGELSRLMLAVLSVYSQRKKLPTIVFDEIDTGVSGNIADKIAQLMRHMSINMQVMSITHLPQVAAKGHGQYLVEKYKKEGATYSNIKKLSEEDRIVQLAKMLSGDVTTQPAMQQAKELLKS